MNRYTCCFNHIAVIWKKLYHQNLNTLNAFYSFDIILKIENDYLLEYQKQC